MAARPEPAPRPAALAATAAAPAPSWRARAELWLWRQGLLWPLALLLLLAAAWVEVGATRGWRAEAQRLEAQTETRRLAAQAAQARAASEPAAAATEAQNQAQARQRLAEVLATPLQDQAVGRLFRLAQAHGIEPARAEYERRTEAASGAMRQRIVLPGRARYPALRDFTLALLEQHPNASVDALQLQRAHAAQAPLDFRLTLTLWQWQPPVEPAR